MSDYEETDEPQEPTECDYVITDGPRDTAVEEFGVKHLGNFPDRDAAEEFIRERGKAEQFWPNVWVCSDHGNYHRIAFSWDDPIIQEQIDESAWNSLHDDGLED